MPNLEPSELERYSRHIRLPEVGQDGQIKLKNASVLVVGVGGLGSAISLHLTAAGVGRVGMVDDDIVELSNLQRQVLYSTDDVGAQKAVTAQNKLHKINPNVQLECLPVRLTEDNASEMIEEYDIIIDGTDNFPTRQIINQTCVAFDKPYVYGAVNRFDGQLSVFHASKGPCLMCLFNRTPDADLHRPEEYLGLFNTLPGVVGVLQASEALKLILEIGSPLIGQLLLFNALIPDFQRIIVSKRIDCPICGG